MNLHTASARAAAALVASVAGAASFEHIASVAIGAGEREWVGYALPLAIDGLILVGVSALLEDRRNGYRPRRSARLAVAVGVLATLAANIASAQPTWTARLVAVAAPVSFLLAVEVLTRTGRKLATEPHVVEHPTYIGARLEAASDDELFPDEAAPKPGHGGSKLEQPSPPRRRTGGKRTAAEKVAAARARHPQATQAEIVKRTRLSARTVARHWHANGTDSQAAGGHATEGASGPDGRSHDGVPELAEVAL